MCRCRRSDPRERRDFVNNPSSSLTSTMLHGTKALPHLSARLHELKSTVEEQIAHTCRQTDYRIDPSISTLR